MYLVFFPFNLLYIKLYECQRFKGTNQATLQSKYSFYRRLRNAGSKGHGGKRASGFFVAAKLHTKTADQRLECMIAQYS
jgi:hypothetical protein